jgi:hypothetical protein
LPVAEEVGQHDDQGHQFRDDHLEKAGTNFLPQCRRPPKIAQNVSQPVSCQVYIHNTLPFLSLTEVAKILKSSKNRPNGYNSSNLKANYAPRDKHWSISIIKLNFGFNLGTWYTSQFVS